MFYFDVRSTLPYLLLVAVGVCLVVWRCRKAPGSAIRFISSISAYGIVCIIAALGLKVDGFDFLRLLTIAVFPGGTALFVLCAWTARQSKVLTSCFLALAVLLLAIWIDAFAVEPHALEVNHIKVTSPKLTRSLKVGVLSDLQTDKVSLYERRVLEELLAQKPDIILLPGDFIQINQRRDVNEREQQIAALNLLMKEVKFTAPEGVYAVGGNVDDDAWPRIFKDLPVQCFPTTRSIEQGGLIITGVGFKDSFNPRLSLAPTAQYQIAFGHGPDFALGHTQADLLVAGHTHGGQVQLPAVGALLTLSRVPAKWASGGLTRLDQDRRLVVTRGAGMERSFAPRLRFCCRPEILIIDLSP